MNKKIPCEDCITLATCIERHLDTMYGRYIKLLKCPIIEEYLTNNEYYRYSRIQKIDQFFINLKQTIGYVAPPGDIW